MNLHAIRVIINALQTELNRYFSSKRLDGEFYILDGPQYIVPEAEVRQRGRVLKIDVESIETQEQFSDQLMRIIEWLTPVEPNPGAASHWKNQPPVDRIGRRPTWLSSSIPHEASDYGSAS